MSEHSFREEGGWILHFDDWNPEQEPLREALCTLGNGSFAVRGAAEEVEAGGPHYPGMYLAGGYNRLESTISGRIIENEDLVNWPNLLCLSFRFEDGEWFNITTADLIDFRQSLDVRRGVLSREIRFCGAEGRETKLSSRRIVHMAEPQLAALQWRLTPLNWSGRIEIRSAIDGRVKNDGVARYRELSSRHLEVVEIGRAGEDGIYLAAQTSQSGIAMVQAARTQVYQNDEHAVLERETMSEQGIAEQRLLVECREGRPLRIEKVTAVYTSKDFAISHPLFSACRAAEHAGSFDELLDSHTQVWAGLWNRADIEIRDGNGWSQTVLRLHIFHLMQTVSLNSIDRDIGVPARGWHGEAYRGHIFWDELFIFPFLNLRMPELTRSLLMYRYRRLREARRLAEEEGCRGAMFPWQSGSTGREESQILHLNPQSGNWVQDHTHRQRHINSAIAYNICQYFQATNDREFLSFYGMEMLLEISRFWASIAEWNAKRNRFDINCVAGPDEFHTQYPESGSVGLNNNAYTNIMAAWTISSTQQALELMAEDRRRELFEKMKLSDEELQRWDQVSRKLYVPFHDDGIIEQFEGYSGLEELDWEAYREKYGDIHRLDRILEAEGDTVNRYKASKQADVLMLFYLFSAEELGVILRRLGYVFDSELIPKNIEYYLSRTSHGSTLSSVVHSWVLARADRPGAWTLFKRALRSDVADVQGGTTSEGIHLGAMAGTVDLIQRCHSGLEMRSDVLWLNPCLPKELSEVRQRIRYRGHWLRLVVSTEKIFVCFEHGWAGDAKVGVKGKVYTFAEGDCREFNLQTGEVRYSRQPLCPAE